MILCIASSVIGRRLLGFRAMSGPCYPVSELVDPLIKAAG